MPSQTLATNLHVALHADYPTAYKLKQNRRRVTLAIQPAATRLRSLQTVTSEANARMQCYQSFRGKFFLRRAQIFVYLVKLIHLLNQLAIVSLR